MADIEEVSFSMPDASLEVQDSRMSPPHDSSEMPERKGEISAQLQQQELEQEQKQQEEQEQEQQGKEPQTTPVKRRRKRSADEGLGDSAKWFSSDSRKSSERSCPVFEPTLEEYSNFAKLVSQCEQDPRVREQGCMIIRAPQEWRERLHYDQSLLDSQIIPHPIREEAEGGAGAYRLNLVERKSMTVGVLRREAESKANQIPERGVDRDDPHSIEMHFWKHLRFNPPTYGADTVGSLMVKDTHTGFSDSNDVDTFNMNKLESILDVLGEAVPGVTTPMLYWGMWKAMFAWHTEDMNLYAINYLHFGAPKQWYAVYPESSQRLELLAEANFPADARNCSSFMRHKNYVMSPSLLEQNSIKFTRILQKPGDVVILLPAVYHSGFNYGFNCAEAVNFALPDWVMAARIADVCQCVKSSVKIDMDIFSSLYRHSKWARRGNPLSAEGPVQLPGEPVVEEWDGVEYSSDEETASSYARTITGSLSASSGARSMAGLAELGTRVKGDNNVQKSNEAAHTWLGDSAHAEKRARTNPALPSARSIIDTTGATPAASMSGHHTALPSMATAWSIPSGPPPVYVPPSMLSASYPSVPSNFGYRPEFASNAPSPDGVAIPPTMPQLVNQSAFDRQQLMMHVFAQHHQLMQQLQHLQTQARYNGGQR